MLLLPPLLVQGSRRFAIVAAHYVEWGVGDYYQWDHFWCHFDSPYFLDRDLVLQLVVLEFG